MGNTTTKPTVAPMTQAQVDDLKAEVHQTVMKASAGILTPAEADSLAHTKALTTAAAIKLSHAKQRAELFAKADSDPAAAAPTIMDNKRYHIYVKPAAGPEKKEFSSFTLEEARALIMYEREETDDALADKARNNALWDDYAKHFGWIVKDTRNNTTYTYNPSTRMLELNLM